MNSFAFVFAAVLLLAVNTAAQIGQGSSAQTNLAARFLSLPCTPRTTRYTPTSSVLGVNALRAYLTTNVDFALSDTPITPCSAASPILQVPLAIGIMSVNAKPGVVVGIKWSGCALTRIYTCIARTFNDPILVNGVQNPRLATVVGPINAIARAEVSGTTYTFTNFMAKSCPAVWRFGAITLLGNAPALARCFTTTIIKARGTSGVRTQFAVTANAVAYIAAGTIVTNAVALQANIGPAGPYLLPSAVNTALLTLGLIPGTPTCSSGLDVTAVRRATYPIAYVAFFMAYRAPRPVRPNNPATKLLCSCLILRNAALTAGLLDFRPLPAGLAVASSARCALI